MSDEIETPVDGTDEKVVTPAQEKRFTQADIDKIVTDRLAREKSVFKTQKESLESEKTSLQTSVEAYEAKLKEMLTPQLDAIPEEYKELVEKLSLLEQVAFIAKLSGKQSNSDKKLIPSTPKPSESDKRVVQRPVGTIV